MTASTQGVFTGLRWPTPGAFDQLSHVTAHTITGPDPRTLPRLGARATDGLWLGVRVKDSAGSRIIPLDDAVLVTRQAGYLSDTSRIAHWRAENDLLVLEQQALVMPDRDVLIIRLTVTPRVEFAEADAVLLMHPAPNATAIPAFPVADWVQDDATLEAPNHFAAIHDEGAEALVTVAPFPSLRAEALRRLLALKDTAGGRQMLESMQDLSAVAMAVGVDQRARFQVGASDDGTGILVPQDAFADALDGELQGNRTVVGDATLGWLVPLRSRVASEVTFFVALAQTPLDALALLSDARSTPAATLRDDAERSAQQVVDTAAQPDSADAQVRFAGLRAVIALEMLGAADSPSIVASAATQPSWGVDRAVDSALVDVALSQAGRLERAIDHRIWWAGLQRVAADGEGPAGTWPGAFYADGSLASLVAAPVDGTAMQLWAHSVVTERALTTLEAADPARMRRDTAESVDRAVDALLACMTPDGDRPCPGDEWDRPGLLQTDWMLVTAMVALDRASVLLRRDDGRRDAALALRDRYRVTAETAVLEHAESMPLHALSLALGEGAVLLSNPDARTAAMARALERARQTLDGTREDGFLLPFSLWQLLVASRNEPELRATAESALDTLTRDGLTPFGHLGMQVRGHTSHAGTPAAAAEATLLLALFERHGRRPPPSLPVPELPRCTCHATDPDASGPFGLVVILVLTHCVGGRAFWRKKLRRLAAAH